MTDLVKLCPTCGLRKRKNHVRLVMFGGQAVLSLSMETPLAPWQWDDMVRCLQDIKPGVSVLQPILAAARKEGT